MLRKGVLVGSVLPDIDIFIWFYDPRIDHHSLATHFPITWLSLAAVGWVFRGAKWGYGLVGLGIGGTLHLALDSILNGVHWLYPFRHHKYALVADQDIPHVKAPEFLTHWSIFDPLWNNKEALDSWVVNLICHWSFLLELSLCIAATIGLWQRLRRRTEP